MAANWFEFLSQILATVLGGALVIAANYLTHRRERRSEEEKQQERNSALFTAVFSVRNFIVASMNEWEEQRNVPYAHDSFKTALQNLQTIIEKSPPDTQYVMSAIYEISLALGAVLTASESTSFSLEQFDRRLGCLAEAIDLFDIVGGNDLTLMSDEELASVVASPEDVLSAESRVPIDATQPIDPEKK